MRSSSRLATASRSARSSDARASLTWRGSACRRRVEPQLEQADQLLGDGRVGGQRALQVALAEGGAHLAQVLGVGPQHRHLPAGQPSQQHESVEPVTLHVAPPQPDEGGAQLVAAPRRCRPTPPRERAGRSRRATAERRRPAAARTVARRSPPCRGARAEAAPRTARSTRPRWPASAGGPRGHRRSNDGARWRAARRLPPPRGAGCR